MIYVNCDASFCDRLGLAGIAYESTVLGNRRQVVRCECPTEAELRAVLMAADDHRGHRTLTLRTDSGAAARPHQAAKRQRPILRATRRRLLTQIDTAHDWHLQWTPREANREAHAMARAARRAAERLFGLGERVS